jgi:asparagine synthase (glutamine-hydrolysing)
MKINDSDTKFHINLQQRPGAQWYSYQYGMHVVWIRGYILFDGISQTNEKLYNLFGNTITSQDGLLLASKFELILKRLSGNFAIIVKSAGMIFAAVDYVRSIPLFFSNSHSQFYISDDASCVKQQAECNEPNSINVQELLLAGYVTGGETLYRGLKQLQAGEYLVCELFNGGISCVTHTYYNWEFGNYFDFSEDEYINELDAIHLKVIESLLARTNDRTIVLPLSGGMDSRVIALTLKRLDSKNVVCFSYGRKGNREACISKETADYLGFPWIFIPYDNKRWRRWSRSEEWNKYREYASGLSSVPHLQDWPAVWELTKNGLIPHNSIFIPGHTALLTVQANIAYRLLNKTEAPGLSVVRNSLKAAHYNLQSCGNQLFSQLFVSKLEHTFGKEQLNSSEGIINALDNWAWKERHAKFIINSVRVYEFWGHEWRIPLWDLAMLDFWARVPVDQRKDKRLVSRYLDQKGFTVPQRNISNPAPVIRQSSPFSKVLRKSSSLSKTFKALKFLTDYYFLPSAFYGINSIFQHAKYLKLVKAGCSININTILAVQLCRLYKINISDIFRGIDNK